MRYPLDQDQPTGYDCVPTTTSHIVDQMTAGVKRPDPVRLRKAAGVPYPKGMSYLDMEVAVAAVSNEKVEARYGLSRAEVAQICPSGRTFGISIDLAFTAGTARQTGFATKGGHTVYVIDGPNTWPGGAPCNCEKRSSSRHSEYVVQDPGTFSKGYQAWSADLLLSAAEFRTGGRGINVLLGQDTTWVWRLGTGRGHARSAPSSKARATRPVRRQAYRVVEIVSGERWKRKDGTFSNAWYRTPHNDFIRGDRLGTKNVAPPE